MSHSPSTAAVTLPTHDAPLKPDQEWANALTHGIATGVALVAGGYLIWAATSNSGAITLACAAYVASVVGTFFFSTLSHLILRQPALDTLRAWDQAMIYLMISGTYTPIVAAYAPDGVRGPLLVAIWVAAGGGFLNKIAIRHRINSVGTLSYLLLGWLPALPLAGHVPAPLVSAMLAGGVIYSIGVAVLINDHRLRYLHAVWHVTVLMAAACHYLAILHYVVDAA